MGLSSKQQAFVAEYLRDFNGTQAAIRAGYSPRTAQEQASRLLSKVIVSEEIKRHVNERTMTADEVLLKLAEHARGDMGDFLDITKMGFVVDLSKAVEKGLTHLIKKVKQRTTITTKGDEETEVHDIEIELYDAQAALVNLGRHHKLFTDKQEVVTKSYHVTIDGEEIGDD